MAPREFQGAPPCWSMPSCSRKLSYDPCSSLAISGPMGTQRSHGMGAPATVFDH